ncbi:putative gamma-glutamyltransferase YwrD [Pseudovibrio axinellae]|uniref:Glutathione hydrolase proenzyme n=1 Tax=Pseudovibrio axinellae TaxID=989403 RepID=A0A166AZ00_9HYPH|nr:gamma-glutamyltransferase [Pseudovibrio axinellae]KZL21732.1 putative gamma-glutamyltransferase YwrD [Pseudovibrio axinellae]SEQ21295.1 gamma-glutamyltransferase 2. Threonine peptidase. MEROPS family T03 [Pseudovibrio axinellae]
MFRDFQRPGRSPIFAPSAMAATSHPLATHAALEILREGGTAADAAVAAIAVHSVVEPHMTGIGGDCFTIVAQPDGSLSGMNSSGRAAKAVTAEKLIEGGLQDITPDSIHAVTVPGALRGWEKLLRDHGKMTFADVLKRAIGYARDGFAVTPRTAFDWQSRVDFLKRDAGASRYYLKDGRAPLQGEVMRLPALAETLEAVAAEGATAFYEGAIAEEIAAVVQAKGGYLSADDLAAHEAIDLSPITTDYQGVTVAELPPNGQGIVALVMLELMKRFDFKGMDPVGVERFHLEVEIAKLAYSGRDRFLADRDHMRFSPEELLGSDQIDRLAALINPKAVLPRQPERILSPKSDTTYLTVVDDRGMAVSLINSIYHGFGSGIATPKSGVLLQNRGACFTLERGHPNQIAGGKRPMHTIIPAMAVQDNKPYMTFGVMGGGYQPCGHAHVLSNHLDFGMDVQQMIDCPRVFMDETSLALQVETSVPGSTVDGLKALGHEVVRSSDPIGGSQAILFDRANSSLIGGSDPRKDGCALGY